MRLKKFSIVALALMLVVSLFAAPPVTAKSKPKGILSGTVTFRGEPVADAWVSLGVSGLATQTNAKGRYSLKVPVGSYSAVRAWSTEHSSHVTYAGGTLRRPEAKTTKIRKDRATRVNFNLAPAATIEGRVVDAEGQPVADIELEGRNLVRFDPFRITTDSEGRYTAMHLSSGTVEISVASYAGGGARFGGSTVARAKAGRTITAPDIRLVMPGVITAEVEWPGGNQDGSVTAFNEAGDDSASLEQDPDTQLWSAKVTPGTWRVTVDGKNVVTTFVQVEEGETVLAGRLVVPEARGVLAGKVLKKNGKPEARGRVRVYDSLGASAGWAKIKKNGRYTVNGLAPGKYFVIVTESRSYWDQTRPQRVQLTAGKTTKATIEPRLKPRHTVRGKVVHGGKGIPGIIVRLDRNGGIVNALWDSDGATKTNAKGEFTIKSIARGKYTLVVEDNSPVYRFTTKALKVKGDVKGLRIKAKK